jgi:hypothetical protein
MVIAFRPSLPSPDLALGKFYEEAVAVSQMKFFANPEMWLVAVSLLRCHDHPAQGPR